MDNLLMLVLRLDLWIQARLDTYDKAQKAKAKYVRPTHDLLCSCRKCEPSINTFWRRMKAS